MQVITADFQHAWRMAMRQPGITLSIILLLALGMGGITAVFNPIYSTIFSPLPLPQPEQLVRIGGGIPLFNVDTGRFENEEILGRIFSNLAVWNPEKIPIHIPDTGKRLDVNTLRVNEDFFETLGIKPLIGNLNHNNENIIGYVVSHRFWRNELMQKSDTIGSHLLSVGESSIPIIGIMPEGFNFPFDTDIWHWRQSGAYWGIPNNNTQYIGRLRTGITIGRAEEELKTIYTGPTTGVVQGTVRHSGSGPILQSLQIYLYGDQRPMLRMLGTSAILFLLLVCAGVVNLIIAQGIKRKQEIATRLIYGATRWNLIFQMLRETLPLVVIGGLAGLWLSEIAGALMFAQMPALHGGVVNVPVKITFWVALVLVVTLIGGLIPALYATGLDLNTYLKSTSGGRRQFISTQEFLVGVQLSIALALLIGVGVLIRSMMFNVDIPIGWSSRDIAVVSVSPPMMDMSRRLNLSQDIQNELRAMPEVMTAGFIFPIPFSTDAVSVGLRGTPIFKTSQNKFEMTSEGRIIGNFEAYTVEVSPDGFDVLGIPFVVGRSFSDSDVTTLRERERGSRGMTFPRMAIINQAFAKRIWPEENPIGKVFYSIGNSYEVVGVVRNYHHIPGNRDFIPAMYTPYLGRTVNVNISGSLDILVKLRPNTSFQNFHSNARQRLSGFPLDWIEARPLNEYVKDATENQRLTLNLLVGFAVLGIIVSGLAVYATATLAAAARTKETGIRMAMGAQTWDILILAFWRGIRAILFGMPFGLFLALILSKVLASFLMQVKIGDILAWIISCGILLVIATVAALIPALRATRVNPIDAMRDE